MGKTTVIREIARVLADELHKRVVCANTFSIIVCLVIWALLLLVFFVGC